MNIFASRSLRAKISGVTTMGLVCSVTAARTSGQVADLLRPYFADGMTTCHCMVSFPIN